MKYTGAKIILECLNKMGVDCIFGYPGGSILDIYEEIYKKLSEEIPVRLSEVNFSRFELDDINTMRELYADILEVNENKAEAFTRILKNIPPITTTSKFI